MTVRRQSLDLLVSLEATVRGHSILTLPHFCA